MKDTENATTTFQHTAAALAPTLGRVVLGLGIAGVGALSLLYGDFALQWQPVPEWLPERSTLAYVSGSVLVVAGASLLSRSTARVGAFALTPILLLWLVLLNAPRVAAGINGAWVAMFEILSLAGASWIIVGALGPRQPKLFGDHAMTLGRFGFAISLPTFGVAHFIYDDFTAAMVPAWIPAHLFWAYFTGVAHIAAGLSLIANIVPRLGATMLALMFTSFAILVNLTRALEMGARVEWTGFCIAVSLTGAAWVVAGSLFQEQGLTNQQKVGNTAI